MLTEEQKMLSNLYELEEYLGKILTEQHMYRELNMLQEIIKKVEYKTRRKLSMVSIESDLKAFFLFILNSL